MNDNKKREFKEEVEEKTIFQKISSEVWIWVLAILAFIIAIALFWKKADKKVYKNALYAPYCVNKKTFSQWIRLFCSDIISTEEYSTCRKLPMSVVIKIRERLGESTEETPVLSKKQIIELSEGSYIALRRSIERYPEEFGIIPSVFKSLSCFPPIIAQRILHCFQKGITKS